MLISHQIKIQHERRELELLAVRTRILREEEERVAKARAAAERNDATRSVRERQEKKRREFRNWSFDVLRFAREQGWAKILPQLATMLKEPHYQVLDTHPKPEIGELVRLSLPEMQISALFLKAHCPRNGTIVEGVPEVSDIDGLPITTALAAQAWRIGDPLSEYVQPPRRT